MPRTGGRAPNAAAPRALAPQRRADAGRVHGMLWRRRTVWLPTLWGALLMLALAAAAAMALGLVAYDLLAPSAPARGRDGGGARTLVVEGFMSPAELDQVIVTLRVARYERVLTTGGPIEQWPGVASWPSFAERAASYLRLNGTNETNGVNGLPVIALPAPASARDRTYLSALMVRAWAQHAGVALEAVDLYSVGVHARRSRLLYRMALGDAVEVGVLAAQPSDYDGRHWWTSSEAAKATLGEALGLAWTQCCFWPEPPGGSDSGHGAAPTVPSP